MKILNRHRILVSEFINDGYGIRELPANSIDTFVDLGANVGMVSLLFRCCQPKARIVAVEPSPGAFKVLFENMENLQVEAYNLAIGSGKKVSRVHGRGLAERWDVSASSTVIPSNVAMVPSIRLSKLFPKLAIDGRVFLKADIEGCETYFRNESETEILRSCDVFIVEMHHNRTGNNPKANLQWLRKVFEDTHLIGHSEIRPKSMIVRAVKKGTPYKLFPASWQFKVEL